MIHNSIYSFIKYWLYSLRCAIYPCNIYFTHSNLYLLTYTPSCLFPFPHSTGNTYLFSLSVHACVLSCFSCVQLFAALWTAACQAPLSMGVSGQECGSGLPCPPPRELSHPGIKPASPVSPALAGKFFTTSATWEAPLSVSLFKKEHLKLIRRLTKPNRKKKKQKKDTSRELTEKDTEITHKYIKRCSTSIIIKRKEI